MPLFTALSIAEANAAPFFLRDSRSVLAAAFFAKVFLHYPPLYLHYTCPEILHVLSEYGVHECCYGHIHGYGCRSAFIGESDGVRYRLVSADFLDFVPYKLR